MSKRVTAGDWAVNAWAVQWSNVITITFFPLALFQLERVVGAKTWPMAW